MTKSTTYLMVIISVILLLVGYMLFSLSVFVQNKFDAPDILLFYFRTSAFLFSLVGCVIVSSVSVYHISR